MPLYDYECACGNEFEKVLKPKYAGRKQKCPVCGEKAQRVLKPGGGGIQCDSEADVKWLKDASDQLIPDGEKPFESRSELKRYLKANNIRHKA